MRDDPSSTRKRRQHLRAGKIAEHIAAVLLMAKGYRILARRFKTRAGEIDIIAKRGQRLAFIEVKQRATTENAEAAINGSQRRRIENAADDWLARHPTHQNLDIAFDVLFVVPRHWPRHIENGL
jgi:putative endonuclease